MNQPAKLTISFDFLTQYPSRRDSEEEATLGRLIICAGNETLTSMEPSEPGPIVSALPLATWLAANWWRIRTEEMPSGHEPDLDWWQSHSIAESANGFAWPDITLWAQSDHMMVKSEPTPQDKHAPYLGAKGGPANRHRQGIVQQDGNGTDSKNSGQAESGGIRPDQTPSPT